jgi:hypothetical protein
MGGEGGPLDDEWGPHPKPLEDDGKPRLEQGGEMESGRNAHRNIPTQDAGRRIEKSKTTLSRHTLFGF